MTTKQQVGKQSPDGSAYVTLTDGAGNLVTTLSSPSSSLTDTELRATPVPVSGTITGITNVVHVDDNSSTLSIDDGGSSITVDGSVTVSGTVISTGPLTDTQLRNTAVPVTGTFYQATQPVSGTFYQATQPVSLASVVQVGDNSSTLSVDDGGGSLTVDGVFYQTTQPVSLASLPNPSNLDSATSTLLKPADTLTGVTTVGTVSTITNVVHVDDNGGSLTVDGSLTVSGPLTDTELRATPVPISVASIPSHAVTNAGTFAVQATVDTLPLPSGASTSALQSTGNTSLSSIDLSLLGLLSSPGTSSSDILGPVIQAVVSESPQSYLPDYVEPLSLTSEGRLRVSTVAADINRVWQNTFNDYSYSNNLYFTENVSYV